MVHLNKRLAILILTELCCATHSTIIFVLQFAFAILELQPFIFCKNNDSSLSTTFTASQMAWVSKKYFTNKSVEFLS